MRNFFSILVAVITFGTAADAADKIKIVIPAMTGSYLTVYVAQEQGFFKQEGLDAEVSTMKIPAMLAALTSGELDYTTLLGGLVVAAMRGLPVKLVAGYLDAPALRLVSQPEIKSVQQLKDKIIGINSVGDLTQVTAQLMLKHFGLDAEKQVKFISLGSDQARLSALQQKLVDAIVTAPPTDSRAKKLAFNVLGAAHEFFRFPQSGLGLSVKRIKDKADEVKRVIKATILANRFIRENPDGAIQVLMNWTKVDRETAAITYESIWHLFSEDGSLSDAGLRLVIEESKKQAKVERNVSTSEVVDLTILKEAQRELGIRGK